MNHKAYITFIDAHSESNGRYNDLDFIFHPLMLDFLTAVVRKIGMIKIALYFVNLSEILCEIFAIFTRDAVNYTTLAFETSS